MAKRRFQIFRRGSHRASDGSVRTYTDADMKKLVKAYDPAKMTAPLVFGHPKHDIPAFGAMTAVEYDEASGKLFGDFEHIPDGVDQQIIDRAWLSGSTSLYTEDNPSNPVPGSLYPKHFGLLGSVPPSVKGMDNLLAHADTEDGAISVEFSEEPSPGFVMKFMEALSGFLLKEHAESKKPYGDVIYADPENGKYPVNTPERTRAAWSYINQSKNAGEYSADKLAEVKDRIKAAAKKFGIQINEKDHQEDQMTEEEKKAAEAKAKKDKAKKADADGNDGTDDNDEDDKKYTELKAQNAALVARLQVIESDKANAEKGLILSHVEGLVKGGKVLPVHKAPLVELILGLPNAATTVEYGEGDEKKSETPRQFFLSFLEASAVKFQEGRAKLGNAPDDVAALRGAVLPKGAQVDAKDAKLYSDIVDYMEAEGKKGNNLSFADAAIQFSVRK